MQTIAGMAGQEGAIDGAAGTNRFIRPTRLALDPSHTVLYFTDVNSFSHRIRKLDLATRTLTLPSNTARWQGSEERG